MTTGHDSSLELWDLRDIKPYADNPKTITEDDVVQMVRLIEKHGFRDPLEVDASGVIVAGHRRYLAARKLGLSRVPVIHHFEMDEDAAKAYRIAATQSEKHVSWNRALLADQVAGFDVALMSPADLGFSERDIVTLFDLDRDATKSVDEPIGIDAEPGPYVKKGETWHIGPILFVVFPNEDTAGMRRAEALIPKLERLVKTKALLNGNVDLEFKAVMAERAMAESIKP